MACYTIVYIRRSSADDDRQVLSLDAQERECRLFLEREQTRIDELIRESHSARKAGRPLFTAMLGKVEQMLAAGKPVRILCHKLDRLLRNLADWARINDLVDAGLVLDFVNGSFPDNAQGKMAFGIMAISAKYYVDNLSEEVKKGLSEKLERGEWPGWAPPGYRNVEQKVEPDPDRSHLFRKCFEYFVTGNYSFDQLARKLYAEGLVGRRSGKRLSKSSIQRILTNPFYCGLMRYRGTLVSANHKPLISVELFQRVQDVLSGASRPRKIRHDFRYAGVLRCRRCGCAVVGDIKKGRYIYYRCSHRRGPCPERYIREETLSELLAKRLAQRVRIPEGAAQSLREAAQQLYREWQSGVDGGPTALERRLEDLGRRQATLLDVRLAGRISDAQFSAKQEELALEQYRVREQLGAFELPSTDPREAVDEFLNWCENVSSVLEVAENDEAREFLRIVGSNYRLAGHEVDFEPVQPFDMATQARNRPNWRATRDDVRTIIATNVRAVFVLRRES